MPLDGACSPYSCCPSSSFLHAGVFCWSLRRSDFAIPVLPHHFLRNKVTRSGQGHIEQAFIQVSRDLGKQGGIESKNRALELVWFQMPAVFFTHHITWVSYLTKISVRTLKWGLHLSLPYEYLET